MSTPSNAPFDFKERYEAIIQKDADTVSRKAICLDSKRKRLRTRIQALLEQANQILKDFNESIASKEWSSKKYIELKAQIAYKGHKKYIDRAELEHKALLSNLDFFDRENRAELLKLSPFNEAFQSVNDMINNCEAHVELFQKELQELLLPRNMKYLSFLKKKASELIDTFERFGIYSDVYSIGYGKLEFETHMCEDFESHIIELYDPIQEKKTCFCIITNGKSNANSFACKYGKNAVLASGIDSRTFLGDLTNMLGCIIDGAAVAGFWNTVRFDYEIDISLK